MVFDSEDKRTPSQIHFTSHNPYLLGLPFIRRDMIWFTEKDQDGASHLFPMTDFKSRRRNDESYWRGYLAGRYGAVPFIPKRLGFTDDE